MLNLVKSIYDNYIRSLCILFFILYFVNSVFLSNTLFVQKSYAEENQQKKSNQNGCINIKSLVFKGNISFSDIRLKMRMKSWHSSLMPGSLNCYNEKWLKKDITALIQFYREKGFPDAEIDYNIKTDEKSKKKGKEKITVEININEGQEYKITFKGNSFFSERSLKKNVNLVKRGNANDIALSKAKVDIKNSYIEAGFQDVTVEFTKTRAEESEKVSDSTKKKSSSNTLIIEFMINEGVRTVVNHLLIKGNKRVSEEEILESMLTRQKGTLEKGGYNSAVLDKDVNAIELLYLSKGFLNAKVAKQIAAALNGSDKALNASDSVEQSSKQSSKEKKRSSKDKEDIKTQFVDIEININEGIQTVVKSSQIKGLDGIVTPSKNEKTAINTQQAMEQLSLRPGEPFREYMVKSDENALSMMVSELGYPHVKVESDVKLNSDKSTADLVFYVDKGKFTRFGNIHYSGNTRLKKDVIEKRLDIESGEPFSLKKVLTTEKRIRESSAVKYVQVKSPGLNLMEEAPDIEVAIEEAKPYFVEAAIGYDTEQSLYIDTKVGDNNFLGQEIDAWVAANVSGIGYRAESGLKKPFFLGTEIDATAGIYVEDKEELNKNFGIKAWGYESGFSRHLFIKNLTAALNFTYENRTVYGDAALDVHEKETRNILITSFAIGYDTRDSLVRPTKGFLSSCSADVYTGFDSELDKFLKYQIDLRKYVSPFNKVTFALRTRMGYIQPFGEESSVAQDQLFFLGGTSNVRGFKENMLEYDTNGGTMGGKTAINSSLEARIDIPANLELNCFVDTGKIDDLSDNLESRGFRSSIGAGLRYITPIGPIGLLYGYKLDPEDEESPGRIHFSVGYTF